ncbi:phage tail tape measure protein [Dyella marensis]|uniref:Phage tail tape measure protein, lambda family n=1 Tax=Dyella marensis TaxID=500610 RepID=A0A1I1ZXJ2_9GAMM|nr:MULTISPECIES: phage tail tape measure protein [Dyella]SFE36366.1 phage tail tape measure protein, lambda family [Dyella marensis]
MSTEGESIGTARLDVVVDTAQFDTAIVSAERRVSSMSQSAQAAYNQLSSAEKRRVDGLIKQADTLNLTRQQQILYNAAIKGIPTSILDELKAKFVAAEVASANAASGAKALGDALKGSSLSDAQLLKANQALAAFRVNVEAANAANLKAPSLGDQQIFKANQALVAYRANIEAASAANLKAPSLGDAQIFKANQALATYRANAEAARDASQALAESDAAQTARIREMVQASTARTSAEQAAIAAKQKSVSASDLERAATDKLRKSADDRNSIAQRAQAILAAEARSRQQSTSSVQAEAAELQKLLGKIDPVSSALDKLDRMEGQLRASRAKGLISKDDYDAYAAKIAKTREEVTKADAAMGHFTFSSAGVRREIGVMVGELARGNFSNLEGSLITLANRAGVLSAAFSPIGALVGAAVLAIGGLAAAAIAGSLEQDKLNASIIATGNYAGVTAGQVNAMAEQLGRTTGGTGKARQELELLVASGKVTGDRLAEAAQGAADFAFVTGESIDKAVEHFVKLQDDPVKSIKGLDEQYHFLTLSQYENIKALQEQGDAEAAAAISQTAAAQAFAQRAAQVRSELGSIQRAWISVREAASEGWDAIKGVGRPTSLQEDAAHYKELADTYKENLMAAFGQSDSQAEANPVVQRNRQLQNSLAAGADLERWAAQTEADNQKIRTEAKKASDVMDGFLKSAKADKDKAAEYAAVKKATATLIAANPADRATYEKNERDALKEIDKKFTDRSAASATKAVNTAEESGQVKAFKESLAQLDDAFKNSQRELDAARKSGLSSEAQYYKESQDLLWKNEAAQITAIQAEIDRLEKRKVAGADGIKNTTRIADLQAQASKIEADAISKSNALGEQQRASYEKRQQAIDAYRLALDKTNDSLELQVNAEIARIGMGDRQYTIQQRVNQAYQEQAEKLQDLALKRQAGSRGEVGGLDQDQYEADVAALQSATERRVAIIRDGYERMAAAESDWRNGAERGLEDWVQQAGNSSSQVASFTTNVLDSTTSFLVDRLTSKKQTLKAWVADVLKDLATIELRVAASRLLSSIVGAFTGMPSTGVALSGPASYTGQGVAGDIANFAFNAKGNVYSSPDLSAYSGKVVNRPTVFAFARGAGVMGEAGPEGILPLTRTSGGKLGVHAVGGGGDVVFNQTVNFNGDGSVTEQTTGGGQGELGQQLLTRMRDTARQVVVEEQRPGGILWRMQRA